MIGTVLEFVLSTHEDGRPKGRTISTTLIYYVMVGIGLLLFGAYTYYQFYVEGLNIDLGFFKFIPFMLILFGFIAIILGAKNVQKHETIKVDRYGITITKGNKSKTASWNEIKEIKSSMTFVPLYNFVFYVELIIIETLNWKHKIRRGNFSVNELKQLFLNLAEHAKNTHINVVDGLEWLPEGFQKGRKAGLSARMGEYEILLKAGLVMLLLGCLIFISGFVLNMFNSNWFAICVVLLFFGCILTIAGGCGISKEKKKMKNV